jgi:hypothetical protein
MAYTTITVDVHQPPDVLVHPMSEITLDDVVLVDELPQAACLILGQILALFVRVYPCVFQNLVAPGAADTMDVCQTDLDPLVAR